MAKTKKGNEPKSSSREVSCLSIFVILICSAISSYVGFLLGLHHGEHLIAHQHPVITQQQDKHQQSHASGTLLTRNKPGFENNTVMNSINNLQTELKCPEVEHSPCPECDQCHACPQIKLCPVCSAPKCPICPQNQKNPNCPSHNIKVTEGTKWTSLNTIDSFAAHDLLLANFPPRKENNPKRALLLTHGTPRHEYQQNNIVSSASAYDFTSSVEARLRTSNDLSSCDEVNVVISKGDGRVCMAVMESYDAPPYHVFRMRRKDQGWVHSARYENKEGNMPSVPENLDGPKMRKMGSNASALLNDFMRHRPSIDDELKPLLKSLSQNYAHKEKGPITLLAVNAGVLDLVLNFLCSVQRLQTKSDRPSILKSILVFAADQEVEVTLEQLGVATYRHHALGSFPTSSASGYGDDVFTSMMWLKVVSVYTVLRLGYDVLFQDADVVWWRDPRPFFTNHHTQGIFYDAFFQNDGARSQRYSPFSANTGFYYLRSTPKARLLMHDLLHSYNLISQWHSHQHVLCQLLVEHYTKTGLNVQILPHRFFSIGQQYHRRKDFMENLKMDELKPPPYMFHWSWTAGKSEKLSYSKEMGMWYLKNTCTEKEIRKNSQDKDYIDGCCLMPTEEPNEHPYLFGMPLKHNTNTSQ